MGWPAPAPFLSFPGLVPRAVWVSAKDSLQTQCLQEGRQPQSTALKDSKGKPAALYRGKHSICASGTEGCVWEKDVEGEHVWGHLTSSTNSSLVREAVFPGSDISVVTNPEGEALLTWGAGFCLEGGLPATNAYFFLFFF